MRTKINLLTTLAMLYVIAGFSQGFSFEGLDYEVISTNPNEVEVVGGETIPINLVIPETVNNEGEDFMVTGVNNNAFEGDNITSVILPNGIVTIGEAAFKDNLITEVSFPESVTVISNEAFTSNPITTIVVEASTPPTINSDEDSNNSFPNRQNIDLTVPVGTEFNHLRNGWTGFNSINGEAQNTFIQFEVDNITYNRSLSSNIVNLINTTLIGDITIPSIVNDGTEDYTVTTIGFGSLQNKELTAVTIPASVTLIGARAFRGNPLTTLIVEATTPPTINSDGNFNDSFSNRQNIDLTVPVGTELNYLRNGWTGFNSINGEAQNTFIQFEVDNITYNRSLSSNSNIVNLINTTLTGDITIPSTVNDGTEDYTVTTIGFASLQDKGLTAVTIPASVTLIGNRAFRGNPLTTLVVEATTPPTINSDGNFNDSFSNRQNIDLTVPQGTELNYLNAGWTGFKSINNNIFEFEVDNITYRITALSPNQVEVINGTNVPQDLILPNNVSFQEELFTVTSIGNGVFEGLDITSVILPNGLVTIGVAAFKNNLITDVSFPESLTTIETEAFRVNQIATVIIPQNVTSIAAFAFSGGNPVVTVICEGIVPPSVASSSNADTFANRQNIDLTVPVGTEAAYEAAGWTGFNSVNGVGQINVGFTFEVNGLSYRITSVAPNEVEATGGSAIPTNLVLTETVSFENEDFTLVKVADNTFQNENFNSVTLPSTMTNVGDNAFRFSQIQEFIFLGVNPPTRGGNALGERANTDLFIPEGTTSAYLNGGWTGFNSITEINIDIILALKVFLQGTAINPIAGEETLMRDDLRVAGLLPTTSPYADSLTVDPTVFETEGNNAIVDWVFVQLRDPNDASIVIEEKSALLQRDGDIVNISGSSSLSFTLDEGDYFISIEHRNHLGILSANGITLSAASTVIDFTGDLSVTQGGINALVEISEGKFAMVAGDFDENGQVQPTDVSNTTSAIGTSAYSNADMDMNGQIQPADINNLVNPNVGRGEQLLARSTLATFADKGAQKQIEFRYAPKAQAANKQPSGGVHLKF